MTKKTIIFTGGGSGGHVMPALTLIAKLPGFDIEYIGGRYGIERTLVSSKVSHYHPIFTGKLRRYFSIQNFIDIFKIGLGLLQSFQILILKHRDTIVFSTGGFVSVPVVIAAWLTGKRIYIHEQTTRVGLANKISSKFADKIFVSFEESLKFFPKEKTELSGYPVREDCFSPVSEKMSLEDIDLKKINKPLLLVTGGGNGSKLVNDLIKDSLEELKDNYFIVHQVGKKCIAEYLQFKSDNYIPVDFINENMIEIMKLADIIISRAGAGMVCELMAINKPSVFIPLKIAQKNEQFHNAKEAEQQIGSLVIEEDEISDLNLIKIINKFNNRNTIVREEETFNNGTDYLIRFLNS
ncbi:MAG: UDP-N-acetylglucosamine--N-acetylmuramyl-(pentapeptide) pyrophosphoryl-undecaprenol N-acetylglucosamine transferase [Bacteriovoracaceae bacterium]|jgi:UDP-N-acetylglucosamine--N-acetylmuramyl-(pentapeptide) pyrophosphoryl-undecaprenol N-acetylglucosamine transferase|nr:UDP-N-acetylglucosamine--N-acetylmuramyl-(pentapeptide) pyrophosphoryl-undecaprenol N-acetylglucosamine transferase [Bacteriovoracaceae bacterium]